MNAEPCLYSVDVVVMRRQGDEVEIWLVHDLAYRFSFNICRIGDASLNPTYSSHQ